MSAMLEALKRLVHWPDHKTAIGDVPAPTPVVVAATIVSPNDVRNPISDTVAAVFHVDFYVERAPERRDPNQAPSFVGSVVIGGDLVVEAGGHHILLPGQRYRLDFDGMAGLSAGIGVSVDRPLPPGCEHIVSAPQTALGALFYRELSLSHGEAVQLIATIDRVHTGGYRDQPAAHEAPLVARPDLAPVVLRYSVPSFR
jgi:hypothetical protein